MDYEFYYNKEYVVDYNPRLMHIGASGGFGCIRARMIDAAQGGDFNAAEQRFWILIGQSLVEAKLEEDVIGIGTLDELIECWFDHVLDDGPDNELYHFIRPLEEGSRWTEVYAAFKAKHYGES